MMTVDGTHCRIVEPTPFDKKWYSHKFHGPGVRYEIAVWIHSGYILWVNGPYHCGLYPDIKIFNGTLKNRLLPGEKVLADRGYTSNSCVYRIPKSEGLSASLLARHESLNRRLKNFNVLSSRFRHNVSLHSYCFHAIANLTQLMIEDCEPLFEVF